MAIDIIVEDGTNVPNANSYITLDEAKTYAANRGVTLPAEDEKVKALIINGTDYIELYRSKFKGVPTYDDQSLSWPRKGVIIGNVKVADNVIPRELKQIACMLVIEANNGPLVVSNSGDAFVKKEKIGPIETEYSESVYLAGAAVGGFGTSFPAVDALLADLLASGAGRLRTLRI